MQHIFRRLFGLLFAATLLLAQGLAVAEEKVFTTDQLDQIVAPLALYPDKVVAQIMMASTYPLEIVQAQRWLEQNKGLKDEQLDQKGGEQGWDPSVVSMLHFPDVLNKLSENLDWTQDLGDAVLAQQKDVMDAVQRMRKRAQAEGNLKTTEQQTVIVEQEVIRVESTTEVVYVPSYNPTVVYGSSWAPAPYYPWYSYPPNYWYAPGYYAPGAGLVAFGVGMAWGAAVWGDCDWGRGDVNVNVNRNTNINNVNGKWQHNASHRQGVRYKDNTTRQRYDQASRQARDQRVARDADRGFDRGGAGDRSGAGDRDRGDRSDAGGRTDRGGSAGDRGASTRDRDTASTRDRDTASTRDRASAGSRDSGSGSRSGSGSSRASTSDRSSGSAFSSSRSGSSTRAASSRGSSSRSGGGRSGGGGRGGGGRR